ncbi:hypothetical protein TNCV_191691 [Trichonephila clavipes]|nr:hypothetical protein TNCV_191691 [Trichonephila clavipes]
MVINVTMKREMSFSSAMLKTQVGSCSILEKAHFANASLCARWQKFMARLQFVWVQLEFDEELQMMVVSPIVWKLLALLVPEAASDAIASISTAMQGARASFKHGRPARARSSNFPVSSKRLTSFKDLQVCFSSKTLGRVCRGSRSSRTKGDDHCRHRKRRSAGFGGATAGMN